MPQVSADLLGTIFYPGSPLHDGAAIIRRDRVVAAGCTLPLSESREVQGMQVHTRHKAALGISEQSDALVVVVSEETGIISLAFDGKMARGLRDDGRLRDLLIREYTGRERPSLRRRRGIIRARSSRAAEARQTRRFLSRCACRKRRPRRNPCLRQSRVLRARLCLPLLLHSIRHNFGYKLLCVFLGRCPAFLRRRADQRASTASADPAADGA